MSSRYEEELDHCFDSRSRNKEFVFCFNAILLITQGREAVCYRVRGRSDRSWTIANSLIIINTIIVIIIVIIIAITIIVIITRPMIIVNGEGV